MSQILEKTLHDPESNSVLPDTSKSLENSSKTVEIYPELQQHRPLTRAIGYSEQQLRMAGSLWLGDCLSILFALSLGLVIAVLFGHTVNHSAAFLVFSVAAYTLCIWSAGLYPGIGKHPAFELKHQALAIATSSTALIIGLSFVSSWRSPYSIAIVSAVPVLLVLLPISRGLVKSALRQLNWGVPCFYLGSSEDVNLVHSQMNKFGWTMLTPVGWFCDKDDQLLGNPQADSRDTAALAFTSHSPFMGDSSNLTKEAKLHGVHWLIYISQDPSHLNRDYPDFIEQFPQIVCARPPRSVARSGVAFISCGLANGVRIEDTLLLPAPRFTKRMIDLVLSGIALLLLSPIFIAIALSTKLTGPGPVFFGHERIGRGGRKFRALKFRSMVPNANQVLQEYLSAHPELQAEWDKDHKLKNDPRITWIGKILRKTSLDELPQLWNVFVGEMSLVGPRPIVTEEINKYGPTFRDYLRVTPGITGLWQISGRNNTTYAERLEYDEFYVRNWSPWMDLYILSRTVRTVILCEGAY